MTQEELMKYKDIYYSIEKDIEFKCTALLEIVKILIPLGSDVDIRRGKSIWRDIRVVHHRDGKDSGEFVGQTWTGKRHNFHYKNVVLRR